MSPAEGRRFGLTVGGAFLGLAGLLWWRGAELVALVAGSAGGLLVAAGLAVPARLGPVQRGWMSLALAISQVTTPVFTAVVYFAVLAPFGVVRRTLGRSPIRRAPHQSSYWVQRTSERTELTRQF